jgi:hypothetical protein
MDPKGRLLRALLEMVMEIFTLVGNLPRIIGVVLFKAMEKSSINASLFLSLINNIPISKNFP